jgi:hypothetical protein
MEKSEPRFFDHIVVWSIAVFVGVMILPGGGKPLIFTSWPFQWYTPFVWIFYTAVLALGSVLAGGIPAVITALLAAFFPTWKKSQKALLVISAFVISVVCVVLFAKIPS